jgi:DNA-binding response OmpR family regulator
MQNSLCCYGSIPQFPVAQSTTAFGSSLSTVGRSDQTMRKKTILIVEDSPGFSELMKFVVEDEGFKGVVFPLNEDFMHWVERERPAAILMDLALNRLSGFDFIRALKAHPKHKHVPVAVITGRDLDVHDITELKMHGIPYLRKGRVDMHEIHSAIRNLVVKEETP